MLLSRLMIFNQREEECRQMEAYFEESGYGVICCSDLDELMEMISKGRHKPEVFVFYIDDSGRRGYEIIEKIRAVSDMAIIVISKDIRLDTQLYAYSKRIDDYMEDPVPLPLLEAHIESGADVTIAYTEDEIPQGLMQSNDIRDQYYTFTIEDGRIKKIYMNSKAPGVQNLSMNIYVLNREQFVDQINRAYVRGYTHFERDVLAPQLKKYNIRAFKYEGYRARICDMKSYFDENMRLLEDENLEALFGGNQIYTKIRDDNPTRYINGSKANNVLVADGCVIEGEVENSILFRGVKVGKGAKVKNCILMQDTEVSENADMEYVITDKNVRIGGGKRLKGNDSFPVYVAKNRTV